MHLAVSLSRGRGSSFSVDTSSPISRNRVTMTLSECDSTTDNEPFFLVDSHHSNGCTRIGAPCSNSLLRLALIAGSAYAGRFTTCIVNVSPSRRGVERTSRIHPYQRKSKHSDSVLRPSSPNDQTISSCSDMKFEDNTRTESKIEREVIDDHQPDLLKRLHLDELRKRNGSNQRRPASRKLNLMSEAKATA